MAKFCSGVTLDPFPANRGALSDAWIQTALWIWGSTQEQILSYCAWRFRQTERYWWADISTHSRVRTAATLVASNRMGLLIPPLIPAPPVPYIASRFRPTRR